MDHINILIADDHALIHEGVRAVLRSERTVQVVGEVGGSDEVVAQTKKLKPDVVILSLAMSEHDRAEATWRIHKANPGTCVLVLSARNAQVLPCELSIVGASGSVQESDLAEWLEIALKVASRGKWHLSYEVSSRVTHSHLKHSEPARGALSRGLTVRELEVARLLSLGKSSKEIGEVLVISVRTVETHRANIMRKLNVHSVTQLLHYASANKLFEAQGVGELNPPTKDMALLGAAIGSLSA